jgi:N-acetylneuraminic acid mutarotase
MKHLISLALTLFTISLFAQNWEISDPLPANASGRNHPITFAIGDTGYVLTGYGSAGGTEMNDFYKYVASTGQWINAGTFPGGRRGFGYGVSHNGKGYAGFGLFINTALRDFWEYDPSTGQWKRLADCPGTPRWHPAMVPADGKVFMGLGSSLSGDLQDWWEYNIASNTWTQKANLPGSRRHHPYYFGIGSDVYAGFGHSGQNIFKDFYRYNYNTDTWTRVADLPAQGRVAGTQFGYGGKGYALSGQGENHRNMNAGEFWEYDPKTNAWTRLKDHPGTSSRWAPGTFVIGNTVYFLCGRSNNGEEKDMMKYTFPIAASTESSKNQGSSLKIYPNPSSNRIFVGGLKENSPIDFTIIDFLGNVALKGSIESSNGPIDVRHLSPGSYIIHIIADQTKNVRLPLLIEQ